MWPLGIVPHKGRLKGAFAEPRPHCRWCGGLHQGTLWRRTAFPPYVCIALGFGFGFKLNCGGIQNSLPFCPSHLSLFLGLWFSICRFHLLSTQLCLICEFYSWVYCSSSKKFTLLSK